MEPTSIIISILLIVIIIYFTRYVFKIEQQVKYQEMQVKLLILLLKRSGVDKKDIDEALK